MTTEPNDHLRLMTIRLTLVLWGWQPDLDLSSTWDSNPFRCCPDYAFVEMPLLDYEVELLMESTVSWIPSRPCSCRPCLEFRVAAWKPLSLGYPPGLVRAGPALVEAL